MRYQIRVPTPKGDVLMKSTATKDGAMTHRNHFRKVVSAGAYIWDAKEGVQVHEHTSPVPVKLFTL